MFLHDGFTFGKQRGLYMCASTVDYFPGGQKVSFGGADGRIDLAGIYPDPPPLHLQRPRHTRGSFIQAKVEPWS